MPKILIAAAFVASLVVVARAQPPGPQASPDGLKQVDVYVGGEGGYHTYRIPSVIATPKGTLLAFAEARRQSAADAGDIDLVLKSSRDGGATWSPMRVIGENGPNSVANPCPVIDARTSRLLLLTTQNLGTDLERDIIAGRSKSTPTVWIMHSDDDGERWSAPREITSSAKRPNWTWYATGPGIAIQTRTGRLVAPANHAEAGTGIHRSHLIFSDDGGDSWKVGGIADPSTNESQVVELGDGRLMLNMRNHPPKPENFRMVAISADAGASLTAAAPDRTLVEPPAQASILRLPGGLAGTRARLLFSNPASAKRERLTVRLSNDDGQTWPAGRIVHDGPAAYSSLVALDAETIGLLYERGETSAYERITFARFPVAWIGGR